MADTHAIAPVDGAAVTDEIPWITVVGHVRTLAGGRARVDLAHIPPLCSLEAVSECAKYKQTCQWRGAR